MQSKLLLGAAVLALTALAGCSTQIETQQTEPFRIRLEGDPQTVTVDEADDDGEEVVVETCENEAEDAVDACDVEQVEVKVKVTAVEGPCSILVTIKDQDTGQVLEERTVSAGGSGNTTTGQNGTTGAGTNTGDASGDVIIQNIVVNVKGKENIVVLTQAQQGSAEVDISAVRASGNAEVGGTSTVTATGTATTSMTTTTTSATTTTTASGNTTTGP